MQQNLKENNIINLNGKIISECVFSHKVYGEGFYNFNIETSRLSNSSDILPVTISERLINRNYMHIGDFVNIAGQIRSYNSYSEKRNKLILTVFVRDIKPLDLEQNKNSNQVLLNGFICKEPVYRTTPFEREISDILLAVNRSYNKSDYIPCIAWGRNARYSNKMNIGDNICISGRMQSRIYQKKLDTGEVIERTAYEVSISNIEVISCKI